MRSSRLRSLTFFVCSGRAAEPESADLRYFRELVETRNYSLGQPVSPQITPDGKAVVFLRGGARDPVLRLYEFTIADSNLREILTPEKLLQGAEEKLTAEERSRRERERQSLRGFTSFQLSKDGSKLLVALSSRLYLVARSDGRVTELPGRNWIDPHFSPDGRAVAAVNGGELHVIDLETLADAALTSGASETLQHGTAEFVAQEEMDRHEGFWWSPDSQSIVYQETDNSGVESRFIADPLHPETAPAKNFYPRAGTQNAKVRLGIVARSGGDTRWVEWDREKYPYLARVVWKEAAAPLCVVVQNRAQQEELLLAVDPATGATRELLRENDAAWLNLDHKPMPVWLRDGRQFFWTTERNGGWQVELHSADGALVRAITPVDFQLDELIDVNEADRSIVVSGGPDSRERHLFRFSPETKTEPQKLTGDPGRHQAVFGENKETFLHRFDLLDGRAGWEVLHSADAKQVAALPSVAERPSSLPKVELLRTEGARPMDAAIVRPRDFKKGSRYPVILDVYAGPGHKQVLAQPDRYMIDQWMADRGYIVVAIDGRGTPGHGRDWERAIRGNLIEVALADQIAGTAGARQTRAGHGPQARRRRRLVVRRLLLRDGRDAKAGSVSLRRRRRAGGHLGKLRYALHRALSRPSLGKRGRLSQEQRPDLRIEPRSPAPAHPRPDRRQRLFPTLRPTLRSALPSRQRFQFPPASRHPHGQRAAASACAAKPASSISSTPN